MSNETSPKANLTPVAEFPPVYFGSAQETCNIPLTEYYTFRVVTP